MAEKETRENKYEAGFSSDAKKEPVRVVFITKKTSAKVTGDVGPQVMTYPHLLIREAIAFMVLVIALVGVALFWDAPLEQIANPLLTPNPAKAPWYFLGLQELLHYFPPLVAGIIIPTLVVVALVIVPYFNVNIQGAPLWSGNRKRTLWIFLAVMVALTCLLALFRAWTVLAPTEIIALLALGSYQSTPSPNRGAVSWWRRERPLSWWVMTWFISVAVVLTLVGTFFRGPGWSWVWPWSSHAG
jgi:quinol-cytochrome oxidoreductase complex cytochrome b subunit